MKKRVLAALLWFYAAWYVAAVAALFLGLPSVVGPVLGAAAAAIIAGDPRRLIWHASDGSTARTPTVDGAARV